ncbi:MAG: transglycosylase SLT domain-containing protein [Myxococcales bacterium]|nr:transglycosylase SLT domain-containing protein [Myxococcales bacterium]
MRAHLFFLVALVGCRRQPPLPTPPVTTTAVSVDAASDADADAPDAVDAAIAAAPAVDPLAALPAATLVGAEAWALAAPALDKLPEGARKAFGHRVARARVAVGLCSREEGERALTEIAAARLLPEASPKPMPELLARLEVDAWVCAERWKEALAAPGDAGLLGRKGALAARTRAKALEATGDLAGARAALDEAIARAHAAGLDRGKLVTWHLALLRKSPTSKAIDAAIDGDLRTLYLDLPVTFDKLGEKPPAPLSAKELLRRADALASAGRADDAVAAVAAAGAAPDAPTTRALARAKGKVLYRAKAYTKAAEALTAASALGGNDDDAIDDAFHAARAKSRAGDDPTAIKLYDALAKKHSSGYGAEAAWLAAQLRYLHGSWADALPALERYLAGPWAKAPKQESNVREAKRARAIGLLASGKAAEARKAFSALEADTHEAFAKARFVHLAAVAAETAGDTEGARKAYAALGSAHPYSFLDLVGRARRTKLGDTPGTWATGPIPKGGLPTLPAPFDLLATAGVRRDLWPHLTFSGKERCAAADALDDGSLAYKLGMGEADPLSRCANPTPWDDLVAALEAKEKLPRGLVHAILRQESGFAIDVVSPAGAVGIAQMLPSTAATTAARLGRTLDPDDIAGLKAPFLQLELSAHHLGDLYRELAGTDPVKREAATALVIAAYNAGAGATKRWLSEAGSLDADVFVERIPFLETRLYVVRVMANLVHYAVLAGAPVPVWPARFPPP